MSRTGPQDNLTAKLPDGVHQNMDLQVSATTSTPPYATGQVDVNGQPVMTSDTATTTTDHQIYVEGATTTAQPVAASMLTMAAASPDTQTNDTSAADALAAAVVADHALSSATTDGSHATAQAGDQQQTTDHPADTVTAAATGDTGGGTAQSGDQTVAADAQGSAASQAASGDTGDLAASGSDQSPAATAMQESAPAADVHAVELPARQAAIRIKPQLRRWTSALMRISLQQGVRPRRARIRRLRTGTRATFRPARRRPLTAPPLQRR